MIKIITIHQLDEWNWYVDKSKNYDFYHTGLYHSLDSNGDPFLFVFHEMDNFVAIPLIRRRIEGTDWYDLSSVYGYTGPISNKDINELDEHFLNDFNLEFRRFLKKERVVSVFSRLHPLLKQGKLMNKFEGLTPNGSTVAIDLRQSLECQRSNYRRSFRADIRKAKDRGYVVKEGTRPDDICLFKCIYTENMLRINASEHYMFSHEYFDNLVNASQFKARLFFVYAGDKAICGTLITCTNNILEVHLVATRNEYLCESPAKFLIDEVSVWAREQGIEFFHFGGGFGFKEDSLYDWKRGFSDFCLDYYSWRFIANPDIYYSILHDKGIPVDESIDFFPLYRCERLALKRA
jgi:hypothetical protein